MNENRRLFISISAFFLFLSLINVLLTNALYEDDGDGFTVSAILFVLAFILSWIATIGIENSSNEFKQDLSQYNTRKSEDESYIEFLAYLESWKVKREAFDRAQASPNRKNTLDQPAQTPDTYEMWKISKRKNRR